MMLNRAYYNNKVLNFLSTSDENIIGELTKNHHFSLEQHQRNAWIQQLQSLKEQLKYLKSGDIFFEFTIPRIGKRVDVILLFNEIIFLLEYKAGANVYENSGIDQVLDYALDLKNFHETSHNRFIVPILIATKAPESIYNVELYEDKIVKPIKTNGDNLSSIISSVKDKINPELSSIKYAKNWIDGGYKPTPTIIEAAQALYRGHNVSEISRSEAGATNLTITTNDISKIITSSRVNSRKSICFITGVPGAGKTLAGLNISTKSFDSVEDEHAVFLSGNAPLVDVLREALARDEVYKNKQNGIKLSKKVSTQKVNSFIQNIHHFRDEGLKSKNAPSEHVVIFDEAQRAWNREQSQKFMSQRGISDFDISEPEFLMSLMNRRNDWCTIICLIGGGQEINTGEAGLIEWFNAIQKSFNNWDVYYSDQLNNKDYNWGNNLSSKLENVNKFENKNLHLSVSIRSFRAERVSEYVGAIINGDVNQAIKIKEQMNDYPVMITRDLSKAKNWLRSKSRGTERFGLVASSGAIRLKPEGIHIKNKIDPSNWFLNDKTDIRSSFYLEDVATQFEIQGLELDWVGVCWDADLRIENAVWQHYNFKGTRWNTINDITKRKYLENTYRVLLTRARQGFVIYVPEGNHDDPTRDPTFYNETYDYIKKCGILEI